MHGLYIYLEIIIPPTTLTTLGQRSNNFGPSYSTKNYAATIQPFISDLRVRQKNICECCGRIGKKDDACIIRGPNFLPTSLRSKMNQLNALHGDELTEPPR